MQDSEIIKLYLERSEDAIPATSAKYGGYCASIARNILWSAQDAEECVSDAYLAAWNSIPPHRPERLSAFLGKLTRNLCYNRYKRDRAERRGGGELPAVLDELSECVSGGETPEKAVDRKELTAALNAFLAGLSEEKRNIFVCRYWYSDSVADIARRRGTSGAAVSMALTRLRRELRTYLDERGFLYE